MIIYSWSNKAILLLNIPGQMKPFMIIYSWSNEAQILSYIPGQMTKMYARYVIFKMTSNIIFFRTNWPMPLSRAMIILLTDLHLTSTSIRAMFGRELNIMKLVPSSRMTIINY